MKERLQKCIAASGLCSRRAAEQLISAGRVTVNGLPAQLGNKVDAAVDIIEVDGNRLSAPEQFVYVMLNKPRGYVTTLSDEKGRRTVADLVSDIGLRLFPVGRLDMDSEGLLLMTNDGVLMQQLIHPKYQIYKTYEVTVSGEIENAVRRLSALTDLEGEPICPATVRLLSPRGETALLSVTIHEGKNRQIRRMCAACGLSVRRLRRVCEDTLRLGTLKSGTWRYLTQEELKQLKRFSDT